MVSISVIKALDELSPNSIAKAMKTMLKYRN
jgi:hypothetical protein